MENLPPELLVNIFRNLDNSIQLLQVVPNVCWQWRTVVQVVWNEVTEITCKRETSRYEILFDKENLSNIKTNDQQVDAYFNSGLNVCKNLKKLVLDHCSFDIDKNEEFVEILASRIKLQELHLIKCDFLLMELVLDCAVKNLKQLKKVTVEMPYTSDPDELTYENVNKTFNFLTSFPELKSLTWKTNWRWPLKSDTVEEMLSALKKLPKTLMQLHLFFHMGRGEERLLHYETCIASLQHLCNYRITSLELGFRYSTQLQIQWPECFLKSLISLVHLKELSLNHFDFQQQNINGCLSSIVQRLDYLAVHETTGLASFFADPDFVQYPNLKRLHFGWNMWDITQDKLVSFVCKKCPNLVELYFGRVTYSYLKALIWKLHKGLHQCSNGYYVNPNTQPLKVNYRWLNYLDDRVVKMELCQLGLCGLSFVDGRPVVTRYCNKMKCHD